MTLPVGSSLTKSEELRQHKRAAAIASVNYTYGSAALRGGSSAGEGIMFRAALFHYV